MSPRARPVGRVLAVVVVLTGAGAAGAQPGGAEDESRGNLEGKNGLAVTLGVGAMDFLGKTARAALTDELGIYADLRIAYGTRTRLGVEVAFNRSERHLAPGALPGERKIGALFGQTFEALLRVNRPGHVRRLFYSPFAVAGLGWTDFSPPDDRDPATPNRRLDRAGIVPLGLGFATSFSNFYAEARAMYRPTFATHLLGTDGNRAGMQAWFAGIAAGIEI
jgi:hypothetical protein